MCKREAIVLSLDELRRLQMTELEILVEFDRICRKHGIKYSLGCGTLLGAIRHNGFVPWDDDIDIWILREDYERFCELSKTELDKRYFFQNWDTDPYFNSGYGKIRKLGTSYIRVGQEKMKYQDGIYIDILPLDNLPDDYWKRVRMIVAAWVFRKLTYAKAGAMCERKLISRIGFLLLSLIPVSVSKRGFKKLLLKYNGQKTLYCKCLGDCAFNPHWRDDFDEVIEWEFEGHMFFVSKRYDSLLKNNIGIDYLRLPPEEQRIPHANASYISFGD